MPEWTWEPDDFAALWLSPTNDRIPHPLRFTSRFAYRDDFDAHPATMRERYSRAELDKIQLALHTLTTSTMRIEIFGGTTRYENAEGDARVYRIVGARTDRHAMSLDQTTYGYANGPIRCRLFPTDHLPARLVSCLPPCRPGTHPLATARADEPNSAERHRRLLHRPADGGGSAVLYTGPANRVDEPRTTVQWHDITGDGRYTELHGHTVHPTTPTDLAAHFATWIDRATRNLFEAE
ncbi:ESX secretion-associated protein EspG [Nocardia australiensis]|uniref:ESX secretion-associated protein EspG n=1 Tax=Nocardia australiensis TaxID=2887191 RepID=UPI001D14F397|nr:ESX secretion-associated protein EspG [Nocardia australiensis]